MSLTTLSVRFIERIRALSVRTCSSGTSGKELEELVRTQLAPFTDLVGSRIVVHGAKLRLNAAAAQAIGLTLHELATNAGKYGALSTHKGHVDVRWELDRARRTTCVTAGAAWIWQHGHRFDGDGGRRR